MVINYSKLLLFSFILLLSIYLLFISNVLKTFIFAASSILAYFSGYGVRESYLNTNSYQKYSGLLLCIIIIVFIIFANINYGVNSLINSFNFEMVFISGIFLLRLINFFD